MNDHQYKLIGHGVYGFAEAHRLTQVPTSTIRRWTQGYKFKHGKKEHFSPPVIGGTDADGNTVLQFADLMEVRVLDQFRRKAVKWPTMRMAADKAREITGHSHPFSMSTFVTDGRHILMQIKDEVLLNLVSDQYEYKRLIQPFLKDIDYGDQKDPMRWWPMGHKHRVVIDPQRSFGAPIGADSGVPTRILYNQFQAEGEDVDAVAWWYNTSRREVKDAVAFEIRLAA